jgi:TatD DNase family protein
VTGGTRGALAPFPFIDSHAHLADPVFAADADAVVETAVGSGAVAIVCIGESRAVAEGALALAGRHPGVVFATAGVHPYDAGSYDGSSWIGEYIDRGAVAIGECGLDYYHEGHAAPAVQRAALVDQIALARDRDVPVVVHTREAEDDTRDIVREAGAGGVRGVLHCYTGSHALAEVALDAGWSISFSGIVTFNRWTDDALLRLVPDDRLLVETDAPYLAPVPFRGRRNEPQYVRYTVARLAAARGVDAPALAATTTANARRLFGLATA